MAQPLASVVIVNWNGRHLLAECLDSVIAQQMAGLEIILVDNGSQDGSVEFLRERYRDVTVVSLPENLGFAGGSNAGMRIAAGKYIVLLNNDTKVDPRWLPDLLREAEAGSRTVGMWACKILTYDDPTVIDNVGHLVYADGLARGKGRLEKDAGQYDEPGEALWPSGCAGMYRGLMIREIGLFDEAFFAYADDVDLGLRARLAGWGCRYVPTAKVYHKYSASSSAYSPFKAFLVERNRIWVLIKYYPVELILASSAATLARLLVHVFGALTGRGASGKFAQQYSALGAGKILLKAWGAAIVGLPSMLRQRSAFAPLKRIGRRELYRLLCKYRISVFEIALKE